MARETGYAQTGVLAKYRGVLIFWKSAKQPQVPRSTAESECTAMALTAAAFALNGNAWPKLLDLEWKPTLMRLQLWRPFTAFLFLGKLDLYYGFTLQFVWM